MNETNIKSSQEAQGGLIQLTSYGNQDLFLTNNPEITFFKTIYRRYTNFGKIYVEQEFDNAINFGNTSILSIQKTGDLLSNAILKIKLPTFNLDIINNKIKNENNVQKMLIEYNYVLNFRSQLLNVVNSFFDSNYTDDYVNELNIYIMTYISETVINNFYTIINAYFTDINPSYYTNACLYNSQLIYIYSNVDNSFYTIDMFKLAIYKNMEILNDLLTLMYEKIKIQSFKEKVVVNWIDKVGIYMFEYFEIFIGSNSISKISPTFVDLYGQTTYTNKEIYYKLINEQSNRGDFIYLQIPFWFIQNYGLSIPLATLHYNNVQLKIQLKNIIELINITIPDESSFNKDFNSNVPSSIINNIKQLITQTFLNELQNVLETQLQITVLFEYITLDAPERKKFIQSGHEYLITQVQELTFNNINPSNSNVLLNFYYCCKNLFWCCTKYGDFYSLSNKRYDKYYYDETFNYSNKSYYYLQYLKFMYGNSNNYIFTMDAYLKGLNISKNISNENQLSDIQLMNEIPKKLPYVKTSNLFYNSTSVINNENNYFNYVQSYNYFNSTPDLGVNCYSYSLYPCVVQPAGACNLGRIPHVSLQLTFNNVPNIIQNEFNLYNISKEDNNQYLFKVMAVNYNVLRFIGGICGLAYQY